MKCTMKGILWVLLLGGCLNVGYGQSIYTQSFTNIDGGTVALSGYQGKKILFVIAPMLGDTLKVNDLAAFWAKYPDSVKLVGIMSTEEGYADSNKAAIKSMYQSRGITIVLTGGMYTKKAAGNNQGGIMKWLTDKTVNKRYDTDASETGQLFFVNEAGKLFSVLIPETSLLSSSVQRNIERKL